LTNAYSADLNLCPSHLSARHSSALVSCRSPIGFLGTERLTDALSDDSSRASTNYRRRRHDELRARTVSGMYN